MTDLLNPKSPEIAQNFLCVIFSLCTPRLVGAMGFFSSGVSFYFFPNRFLGEVLKLPPKLRNLRKKRWSRTSVRTSHASYGGVLVPLVFTTVGRVFTFSPLTRARVTHSLPHLQNIFYTPAGDYFFAKAYDSLPLFRPGFKLQKVKNTMTEEELEESLI